MHRVQHVLGMPEFNRYPAVSIPQIFRITATIRFLLARFSTRSFLLQ